MAYLVFARKYRPLVFEDVVGQSHITDTLKRAIEKDRVAHAYIFTGTRGVGKTTTARILARALNCENGPTTEPCGTCASCQSVIKGNSFDVMEIDGASNNGVDDIRELRDSIGYTSMGGKYRIFVIDEVHMLSTGAFNALLKTLEEPPEKVIFIFATTEPHKIPDTIHSRCQRYDFRSISEEQIGGYLKKICDKESITFDNNSISLIAHKGSGSMRDSLSLLDQATSFCGESLTEEEVRSVLGLVSTESYQKILSASATNDSAKAISILEEILHDGYDLSEFITGFQEYLRTLLFLSIPGGASNLVGHTEDHYREIASQFSEGDLIRMSELVKKAEQDIKFSSMPRFVVELMLVKLVTMDRTVLISELLSYIKDGVVIPSSSTIVKKKIERSKSIENNPSTPVHELIIDNAIDKKVEDSLEKTISSDTTVEVVKEISNVEIEVVENLNSDSEIDIKNDISDLSLSDKFQQMINNKDHPSPVEELVEPESAHHVDIVDPTFTEEVRSAVGGVKSNWGAFLSSFAKERQVLASFLERGRVVELDYDSIDIRFHKSHSFQQHELAKQDNRKIIRDSISKFWDRELKLHITIETDDSVDIDSANSEVDTVDSNLENNNSVDSEIHEDHHKLVIVDEIHNEPVISKILEIFDGEVI